MAATEVLATAFKNCGSGVSSRLGFLHGTASAMLFSLMAPCGPLYFARRDIPVACPCGASRRDAAPTSCRKVRPFDAQKKPPDEAGGSFLVLGVAV
jgi:hypothetical protein